MKNMVLFALIAVLLTATNVSSASAHSSAIQVAKKQYYHTTGYIKAIGKHARRTIYSPNPQTRHKWQAALHYLVQVRHRAYLVLHPTPVAKPLGAVSHLAMWLCIHAKEGAWNANTGNGYYGGLQMTSGWGGVSRPDLLSPGAQIALAEAGYRASGYSLAWIRQQWPNTSYGCI